MSSDESMELTVNNPDSSVPPGSMFGVRLPKTCVAADFDAIVEAIEFRRKCHNQGFDNLIDWINMSRKNILASQAKKEPSE